MKNLINNAVVVFLITILLTIWVCTIPILEGTSSTADKAYASTPIEWSLGNNCKAVLSTDTGIMIIEATGTAAKINSYPNVSSWPWHDERDEVKEVVFEGDISVTASLNGMFENMHNLTEINGISDFDTSNATDMSSMFAYCENLGRIDLLGFNTDSLKNMSNMFRGCSSLTSLDLSSFDTSLVTGFQQTFSGCTNLTSIYFPLDLNTSKITSMMGLFEDCSSLKSLDLSAFNTDATTTMNNMFDSCTSLIRLTLGANFMFVQGSNQYPPSPSGTAITGFYTGKWVAGDNKVYASNEIPNNTPDTYNAQILPVSVNITDSGLNVGSELIGVIENDSGKTFTYQWARGDSSDGPFTDISGATSGDYTLTDADAGKYIRCTVEYENISVSDVAGPVASQVVPIEPASNATDDVNNNEDNGSVFKQTVLPETADTADLVTALVLLIITAVASILSLRFKTRKKLQR